MRRYIALIAIIIFGIVPIYSRSREDINRDIDKANELRQKDCHQAIGPLYDLYIESSDNGYENESAKTLAYMGWALYNCNYPDLSLQVLKYAQGYEEVTDTHLRDIISMGLGVCYVAGGDFVKGERQLEESLQQSMKVGNQRETMMIYTYLGDLYSKQAKDNKAKENFEKGRKIAHELKDTLFEAALYCNLGTLCIDFKESEDCFFKSIDLSQKIDDKKTESYAYVNLSELYYNQREYVKAIKIAEQINRFLPYLKSNDKIISYLHNLLSEIYAEQGDYASSYNQMQQVIKQQRMDYSQIDKERTQYNQIVIGIVQQMERTKLQQQKEEQFFTFKVLLFIILLVVSIALIYFVLYRKSQRQQRMLTDRNQKIITLEEASSRDKDEISDTRRTMNYLYGYYRGRDSLLEKLSDMVKQGYKMNSGQLPSHLRNINYTITQCYSSEKAPDFVKQLEDENASFIERLRARYPEISKTDIMLATYYRLGLSTRDISRLSGKLATTVTTARYRLRTSMNIPEDADLTEFFNSI